MADLQLTWSDDIAGADYAELKAALAADRFDNGRTVEQYAQSFTASHAAVFVTVALPEDSSGPGASSYVGNGRILSDGVCNAYLVDIWTAAAFRRRGVGSGIVRRLLATVPGQHVALMTDNHAGFYRTLGFQIEPDGMSIVMHPWLGRIVRGS